MQFDLANIVPHTNINLISKKHPDKLVENIKAIFWTKYGVRWINMDKTKHAPIDSHTCVCFTKQTHEKYSGYYSYVKHYNKIVDPDRNITFFCGKFDDFDVSEIYKKYFNNGSYSFDEVCDIFRNKNIIVVNDGNLSYYNVETFDTNVKNFWNNKYSFDNVSKLINEIESGHSVFHLKKSWLHAKLKSQLAVIKKYYFVAAILVNELPTELRNEIICMMILCETKK